MCDKPRVVLWCFRDILPVCLHTKTVLGWSSSTQTQTGGGKAGQEQIAAHSFSPTQLNCQNEREGWIPHLIARRQFLNIRADSNRYISFSFKLTLAYKCHSPRSSDHRWRGWQQQTGASWRLDHWRVAAQRWSECDKKRSKQKRTRKAEPKEGEGTNTVISEKSK